MPNEATSRMVSKLTMVESNTLPCIGDTPNKRHPEAIASSHHQHAGGISAVSVVSRKHGGCSARPLRTGLPR